jgi:hypothetical protein
MHLFGFRIHQKNSQTLDFVSNKSENAKSPTTGNKKQFTLFTE